MLFFMQALRWLIFRVDESKNGNTVRKYGTFQFLALGLGPHLFVKVPRPGDSEVDLCGLRAKMPPVTTSLTTQR